ncbi:M48 family peptidase (plasmid) [Rhizobium ruizarguesonis]|uniref:M48 family peptidase n=1 Tax=Rhizobium ruizarguesonis TaxID=2081791 RepID=A0ABY1X1U6_9HYPH|nr:SprT family zinc-dependent metalloprotease [Rhizobium ruizarguesonis]TAU17634.1 M48 family peptidase [Rhizobium ruizarguesonis]TAU59496.1 M48 family peptidase [Rhizobium ruizarguesonis]TAU71998.1 M48 family peptidase [Rhizobium ruizarguesonis]TAV03763.1 M48 family peptidase [Rhizobium ruizarguesonis]TAV23102.1 M48 family peptidase [Rhizobium ruizarguesonis]
METKQQRDVALDGEGRGDVLDAYPPHGRIRVAAPLTVSDDAVRLAVVTRMGWIKRQRAKFDAQPRQSERTYISGESHFFLGQRYRLNLIEGARAGHVHVKNSRSLDLHVRNGSDATVRERVFLDWYREELRSRIAPLIDKWASVMEIPAPTWGIKRMKTKWGTCNIEARRIWLNLELIKKPPQCLEYVIVQELTHFFERRHSEYFVELLDNRLPNWRIARDELNSQPLAHEEW